MPATVESLRSNFPKITINQNALIFFIIGVGSIAKVIYAWTREVFPSGPDANGYIPIAERFSQFGFFGDKVDLPSIYSAGYPFFLSFFEKIFDDNFFKASQAGQIILFGIGTVFFAKSLHWVGIKTGAVVFTLAISFHPAWLVATSMAMYESLLYFLLSLVVHTTTKQFNSMDISLIVTNGAFLGLLFGCLATVHPRGLLFSFPFLLALTIRVRKRIPLTVSFLGPFLVLLSATMYRTRRDSGNLNLGGNLWASSNTSRAPEYYCENLNCLLRSWQNEPLVNFAYFFENAWKFITPYSGPAVRGTWFHNLSAQYRIGEAGLKPLSLALSYLLVAIGLIIFAWASIQIFRHLSSSDIKTQTFVVATFSSITLMLLTDGLTYGDNRHRLLAIPLTFGIVVLYLSKYNRSFNTK
jgi:hypothetical protein